MASKKDLIEAMSSIRPKIGETKPLLEIFYCLEISRYMPVFVSKKVSLQTSVAEARL